MFRLRDLREKETVWGLRPVLGLEEDKSDLAQSRGSLDTQRGETEVVGQPVPKFQSVS